MTPFRGRPWLRGRITNEYALSWQSGEVSCPILCSLNKALPLIKSHSAALSIAGGWRLCGWQQQELAVRIVPGPLTPHTVAGRLQHACQCESERKRKRAAGKGRRKRQKRSCVCGDWLA